MKKQESPGFSRGERVNAWTNPFGRLPQTLAMSALAILVTGVALCVEKRRRELRP